jgi:hypothetical protein
VHIDNPFAMVVLIVFIVTIGSIIRAKLGVRRDHKGNDYSVRDDAEAKAMRAEMKVLKDRLAVLERIAVEKENSLEREIEQLRDQHTS